MKIKAGVNFHNRFDIVKNGEWVGYAENIILDRAFTAILNRLTTNDYYPRYFRYINFGTGTGSIEPTRTTLFAPLGAKEAEMDEIILALPTSKVVRKITINPEEYVGATITEVGVSDSVDEVNTHALIKDSEGNPLSLTKTALDVLVIYATIFVTLNDSGSFTWQHPMIVGSSTDHSAPNKMLQALIGPTRYPATLSKHTSAVYAHYTMITLQRHSEVSSGPGIYLNPYTYTQFESIDIEARKWIFSKRFGITEGNGEIKRIGLFGYGSMDVSSAGFDGKTITNKYVGVGDGVTKEFILPNNSVNDLVIKLDGTVNTDYIVLKSVQKHVGINKALSPESDGVYFELDSALKPVQLIVSGTSTYSSNTGVRLRGSNDGITYTNIIDGRYTADDAFDAMAYDIVDSPAYKYYHITGAYSYKWTGLDALVIFERLNDTVVFDEPPLEGTIITADYAVDYIPKDEDHVLDVTFEIQFGEGV